MEEKQKDPDKFVKEYEALCEKFQLRFNAIPAFVNRDDGTFSVVIRLNVVDLPKK